MANYKPFKKQTLAEQVADSIEESIVLGNVQGGDMLPTEPEMSEQFGVSRAVVRDATRMLAAKGLIEVQHGKGSFVTQNQFAAFGDALLLALRRMDATNWDVAQFEQVIYPEILALAAINANDGDIATIEAAAEEYLKYHAEVSEESLMETDSPKYEKIQSCWAGFVETLFNATHNKVISLLAHPLIQIHGIRNWEGLTGSITAMETQLVTTIINLVKSHDPVNAREEMHRLLTLPAEAITALQQTAIGTPTMIVIHPSEKE